MLSFQPCMLRRYVLVGHSHQFLATGVCRIWYISTSVCFSELVRVAHTTHNRRVPSAVRIAAFLRAVVASNGPWFLVYKAVLSAAKAPGPGPDRTPLAALASKNDLRPGDRDRAQHSPSTTPRRGCGFLRFVVPQRELTYDLLLFIYGQGSA
jgi:hypothetical protein